MSTLLQHATCIRLGTEADAAFFFEIDQRTTWESLPRSCGTSWDRAAIREALCITHQTMLQEAGHCLFIAEVESDASPGQSDGWSQSNSSLQRAGLLWFGPRRNLITGENEGWIYNVTVVPEFRGRGLAKDLIEHAERHAQENSYRVVGLSVATHNEVARGLYAAQGYGEHTLTMRKALTSPQTRVEDEDGASCTVCREGKG